MRIPPPVEGGDRMRFVSSITGLGVACLLAACGATSSRQSFDAQYPLVTAERSDGWSRADRLAHREAFLSAVKVTPGEAVDWTGDTVTGRITSGEARLAVSAEEPAGRPAPAGLRIPGPMEMDLGVHALRSNANVRLGPSTDDKIVATLKAGTRVEVAGRLVREPWALVAQNGRVRGYIFEELLIRPEGAASRLAGARLATPTYCRRLSESVGTNGSASEWSSFACNSGGEWILVSD